MSIIYVQDMKRSLCTVHARLRQSNEYYAVVMAFTTPIFTAYILMPSHLIHPFTQRQQTARGTER